EALLQQRGGGAAPGAAAAPPPTPARRARPADAAGQFGLFAGLEDEGEAREGDEARGGLAAPTLSGDYRCVRTKAELDELIAELRAARVIAIDTETTGLSPLRAELCGVAVSVKPGTGAYVPIRSPEM